MNKDKEIYASMNRSNFMEHSFDIIVKDTANYSVGSLIYFGNIDKIECFSEIPLVSTGLMLEGFEYTYNDTYNYFVHDSKYSSKLLFCNTKSTQILKIGNLTLHLKYYTKDQILNILRKYVDVF